MHSKPRPAIWQKMTKIFTPKTKKARGTPKGSFQNVVVFCFLGLILAVTLNLIVSYHRSSMFALIDHELRFRTQIALAVSNGADLEDLNFMLASFRSGGALIETENAFWPLLPTPEYPNHTKMSLDSVLMRIKIQSILLRKSDQNGNHLPKNKPVEEEFILQRKNYANYISTLQHLNEGELFLPRLEELIAENRVIFPFAELTPNQAIHFETLRDKLGDAYPDSQETIERIVTEVAHQNDLIRRYLADASWSYKLSIAALLLTAFSLLASIAQAIYRWRRRHRLGSSFIAQEQSKTLSRTDQESQGSTENNTIRSESEDSTNETTQPSSSP